MQLSDSEIDEMLEGSDEEITVRKGRKTELQKKQLELDEVKKQLKKMMAEIRNLQKQVKEMVVGMLNAWQNLLYLQDSIIAVNYFLGGSCVLMIPVILSIL